VLVQQVRTSTSWLVTWAVLVLLPLGAYAQPLIQWALSDNPLAYLVWIPVIAMVWAVDNLRRVPSYPDDAELNSIMGGALAVTVGFALIAGPHLWPYVFTSDQLAFLLWPLWALALAWLWFGVATTKALIAPLAYLLLAWPPVLSVVVAHTQGPLLRVDQAFLGFVARGTGGWLAITGPDIVRVLHAGHGVLLAVATACSGTDSLLGALIVLPFVLSRAVGPFGRKVVLVVLTGVASLVLNLVRMAGLLVALHLWGEPLALGVLHPLLGPLLFAALAFGVVRIADRWSLVPVEPPPSDDVVALPSPGRTVSGLLLACALGAGLLPALTAPGGPFPRSFRLPPRGSRHVR
jgi:exosortase/archaeosortase family protein